MDPEIASVDTRPHHRHAATAVWCSAGLLLAASVCFGGSAAVLSVVSIPQLRQMEGASDVPAEVWDELAELQPHLAAAAVATGVLVFLPGLALLVLGFGVRAARRGRVIAAQACCGVPLTLLGLNLLISLPSAARGGGAGVLGLLPMLGLVAVLFWTVRRLGQAKRFAGAPARPHTQPGASPDDDPWEHML